MVYFSEDAVEHIENGLETKSGVSGVQVRSGMADFDSVLENIGVASMRRLFPANSKNEELTRASGLHRWYLVAFDESSDLDEAARSMAEIDVVERVEFNQKLRNIDDGASIKSVAVETKASASGFFNDPRLANQWHYINTGDKTVFSGIKAGADINAGEAWKLCTGDPRIIVAVVDGGVQWNHPDLEANMWTNTAELNGKEGVDDDGNGYIDDIYGYNFVENTSAISPTGHGTHVAGTVAAVNNNGIGVCGVAGGSGCNDGVKIMSCQIFKDGNEASGAANSAMAIKYAADNGAAIIQCSFGTIGGEITSDEVYVELKSAQKDAIDYFLRSHNCDAVDGGIAIFAAGNDGAGMSGYPGGYKDYISVTSMSCDFTPAYYTNYGSGCNVAAPGGDMYQSILENDTECAGVLSTIVDDGYGWNQGTSMACPHVSGVAALGLSYALKLGKHFTRKQFNSLLLTSVNNIDAYCTGEKQYRSESGAMMTLDLSKLKGLMGTGYIDAYQVLMNVRGATCIPASVGSQTVISMKDYIGDGNANIKVTDVRISDEDMEKLGISSKPTMFGGKILFTCKKSGSGIMNVEILAGTGNGSGMSGMTIMKEFAIIARDANSENGGWL